jgi:hypothetical protein
VTEEKSPISMEWELLPYDFRLRSPDGSLVPVEPDNTAKLKATSFSDSLKFDDDVPAIVQGRYASALCLALSYDGDCTLYDCGPAKGQDHYWVVFFNGVAFGEVIPLLVNTNDEFLRSLQLTHELLELVYSKGITLVEAISGNEASVSAPVKGDLAPVKGG